MEVQIGRERGEGEDGFEGGRFESRGSGGEESVVGGEFTGRGEGRKGACDGVADAGRDGRDHFGVEHEGGGGVGEGPHCEGNIGG